MTGLQRLCRLYGRMKCGDTMMVWDYAAETAVPEGQMPLGSKRWRRSEKAKYAALKEKPLTNLSMSAKRLA